MVPRTASGMPGPVHHFHRYAGADGFFIDKFLVDDTVNKARWGLSWPGVERYGPQFAGKPLVLTPWMDHPMLGYEEPYRIGGIKSVDLRPDTRRAYQISSVTDPAAQRAIENNRVRYGSIGGSTPRDKVYLLKLGVGDTIPAFDDTPEHMFVSDDDIVKLSESYMSGSQLDICQVSAELEPYHDALVAEPAYGRDKDYIQNTCEGSSSTCHRDLEESRAASYNSDELAVAVPLVASVLGARFADCALASVPPAQGDRSADSAAMRLARRIAADPDFARQAGDLVESAALSIILESKNAV